MWKIGDNVLCKHNYHDFYKNKYYEIYSINFIFESDDYITIKNNNSLYRFTLIRNHNRVADYLDVYLDPYFYDYFYSKKEIRKMKIELLDES